MYLTVTPEKFATFDTIHISQIYVRSCQRTACGRRMHDGRCERIILSFFDYIRNVPILKCVDGFKIYGGTEIHGTTTSLGEVTIELPRDTESFFFFFSIEVKPVLHHELEQEFAIITEHSSDRVLQGILL